jgi:hypothetical protein
MNGTQDIVIASYGVLDWIRSFDDWVHCASRILTKGGRLHIIDTTPSVAESVLGDTDPTTSNCATPLESGSTRVGTARFFRPRGTYADRSAIVRTPVAVRWHHSLDEILECVCASGLAVNWIFFHPFDHYKTSPRMKEGSDGYWYLPDGERHQPLLFSLCASKL